MDCWSWEYETNLRHLQGRTARPIALATRYNSGYGPGVFEPVARIGFSATTSFRRSDFGMTFGVPPEGSDVGVGDEVSVQLEMEFVSKAE